MSSAPPSAESSVFVSALLTAIERGQGAPRRAGAEQWSGWLDGAQRRGEFKQEERDWLEVDTWLEGQAEVTREQLLAFVNANQVQVLEVLLGGGIDRTVFIAAVKRLYHLEHGQAADERALGVIADLASGGIEPDDAARVLGIDPMALNSLIRRMEVRDDPKHASPDYQLPGGQNYRELLLTLPERKSEQAFGGKSAATMLFENNMVAKYSGEVFPRVYNQLTPSEVDRYEMLVREDRNTAKSDSMAADRARNYRSSHFDHLNILAHVRFNERTAAGGTRVLFLEEVQSDWHQAGRKQGYKTAPHPITDLRPGDSGYADGYRFRVLNNDVGDDLFFKTRQEALNEQALEPAASGVPDAPFKTTWPMLAMKRMVRYAAEHGFDRIAWTTGEQQADRYDLRKKLDRIVGSSRQWDGARTVFVNYSSGDRLKLTVDGSGTIEGVDNNQGAFYLLGKPLSEVMGQEVANRIMTSESSHGELIEAESLKFGGDGMRAFYDTILPNEVNKFAKRFGGRVGAMVIAEGEYNPLTQKHYKNGYEAHESQAHSIDITPAMRDAALTGMPLFKRGEPEAVDADDEDEDERPTFRF